MCSSGLVVITPALIKLFSVLNVMNTSWVQCPLHFINFYCWIWCSFWAKVTWKLSIIEKGLLKHDCVPYAQQSGNFSLSHVIYCSQHLVAIWWTINYMLANGECRLPKKLFHWLIGKSCKTHLGLFVLIATTWIYWRIYHSVVVWYVR